MVGNVTNCTPAAWGKDTDMHAAPVGPRLLALTPGQEIVIFPARILRYARNAGASGTGGLGMQEYEGPVGRRRVLLRYARNAGVRGTGGRGSRPPVPRTPA